MDIFTLVVGIIIIILCAGLLFRLVTYTLRVISLLVLIILLLAFVGSYLQVQAFFLTSEQQSFMTLTDGDVFVISQNGPATLAYSYSYDPAASVSLMKEFLFFSTAPNAFTQENSPSQNTTLYEELRKLSRTDLFVQSDTVWLIDARKNPKCTLDAVQKNIAIFTTNCIPPKQEIGFNILIDSNKRQQILKQIPLKSDIWLWVKHQVISKLLPK